MTHLPVTPPATIHLIGICGTGMGALAGLLVSRGYTVTGSDLRAYPPMSMELASLGITIMEGYKASNLNHHPDLVVVGNICRPDHPEAEAARSMGLNFASLPRTVHTLFLTGKQPIVVAGTHGKTTIASLIAFLLHTTGRDPSFLVGGITSDFGSGYRLGQSDLFVIEGDEYDSAYFEKIPKFLSYAPSAAVITSVEHDHLDIYPTYTDYKNAFAAFANLLPHGAPLAVYAGDRAAVDVAEKSPAQIIRYGVIGDAAPGDIDWLAVPDRGGDFDLVIAGKNIGHFRTPIGGNHNLRNTVAALIMCHLSAGVSFAELGGALPSFKGVKRRQEIIGKPGGITLYDDFAHHPTAVKETLRALAPLHPAGRLLAAFEPRSATACRRFHQKRYAESFDSAGRILIAPPGRELPTEELLDTGLLAEEINARGGSAAAMGTIDDILAEIVRWSRPGDGVVLLSNGGFGGLKHKVLEALN
jgi:UDP-N-acetylmuramate: L-alanyl-gamma-D-glutamyl-meso-diaminopimelate ligase